MLRWLRQSLRQVSSLMARRPVLVCGAILLSVLLLLAVTFTCSRAKNVVASARPPVRFFSAEAPVVDLYLGQLEQVERLRGAAEVSVIFFYAPWCAHSIAARHEVQEVARRLVKQVQFVAVNCWWSQGKCRKQKSFYQYPVIHLFYKRFGPIEYKGPFLASYVERFILRVITPLTYLPSRATLQDFLSYHEPGVVGYFQFNSSPQPPGYITYLSSALQALKRDFRGAVRFGVVTSRQVAESISVRDDQTVYLHRHFNSSLIFPSWERNFTSEGICSWVFEHRETVLQWLAPTGAKSRLLEQELTKGPALLLFLPHNPLGPGPDPLLTQIADVAVRYHSCSDSPHHHHHHPSDHYYYSGPSQPLSPPLCCLSVVLPRPHPLPGSTSRVCELCLNQSNPGRSPLCTFPSQTSGGAAVLQSYLRQCCLPVAATGRTVACSNILSSYSPSSGRYSACCRTLGQLGVSLPPQQVLGLDNEGLGTPPPSPSYSQDSSQDDSQDSSQDSSPSSQDQEAGGIKGLRCRTNKTLRFYILDSALHWPLAVRLGALGNNEMGSGGLGELGRLLGNGTGDGAQSFATIVNLKDEVHYVLDHRGTATVTESLELFIRNFSTSHSPLQRRLVGRREEEERPQKRPLISELTTTSFLTTVMDPHRDVVLFYYSQWCGYKTCCVLQDVVLFYYSQWCGYKTCCVLQDVVLFYYSQWCGYKTCCVLQDVVLFYYSQWCGYKTSCVLQDVVLFYYSQWCGYKTCCVLQDVVLFYYSQWCGYKTSCVLQDVVLFYYSQWCGYKTSCVLQDVVLFYYSQWCGYKTCCVLQDVVLFYYSQWCGYKTCCVLQDVVLFYYSQWCGYKTCCVLQDVVLFYYSQWCGYKTCCVLQDVVLFYYSQWCGYKTCCVLQDVVLFYYSQWCGYKTCCVLQDVVLFYYSQWCGYKTSCVLQDVVLFYYSQWCGYKTCCVLQDVVLFYYSQWCGYKTCCVLQDVVLFYYSQWCGYKTCCVLQDVVLFYYSQWCGYKTCCVLQDVVLFYYSQWCGYKTSCVLQDVVLFYYSQWLWL
ncbi:thioredoxin domain-containing protein 11-like isoform X1 [Oncorhynchus mykiss]|uniref:thioredoxin domain-containing protein 11-like isoform X1 n=1 Tax=Oncorhynchus mykiss TaxID=8022 RepID=UPI0018784AB0|nr:thioredoxin domain-containing protein 11-like isoform X1 [Oncorhynchus mykiss]